SSGLLVGKIQIDAGGKPSFKPHQDLLPQDYLRVGYEDERWHATLSVTRRTPKSGTMTLRLPKHKTPQAGTPVFLIDRRDPEMMRQLADWEKRLKSCKGRTTTAVDFTPRLPNPAKIKGESADRARRRPDMLVLASLPLGRETRRGRRQVTALWMTPRTVREVSRTVAPRMAWWLPPVIWQNEEALWRRLIAEAHRNGARHFVAGAPWQASLFEGLEADLIAGPFCNAANALALEAFARMGFKAAFASPELARTDLLHLPRQSPLPLGLVIAGFWPLGIARHESAIRQNEPFASPKNETFWTHIYGQNTWIYPVWPLDLTAHRAELEAAGYGFFATLEEHPPRNLPETTRPGLFNWETGLL
ncbi:MAG: U32 family peptidase, partial [Deltaproteobacteria bacterium]|nr:U32 family peptidase [Deltaproteobacteria bacterium]